MISSTAFLAHRPLSKVGTHEKRAMAAGQHEARAAQSSQRHMPGNSNLRTGSFMKLGLINSAWVQSGRGTAYGIRMTKEIGFDSIDIFTDPLDIDVKERLLIRRECEKAELPI